MCERCEAVNPNNPVRKKCKCKTLPKQPVISLHGYCVLYPDLMEFRKTYKVEIDGEEFLIGKPDIGVISILKIQGDGKK